MSEARRDDGRRVEMLERRLAEARSDARALAQVNDKLNQTLRDARESLLALREQLDALAAPPSQFGLVTGLPEAGLADVAVGGRALRVKVSPELVAVESLQVGASVLLNEAMTVVGLAEAAAAGEIVRVREPLGDDRVLAATASEEEIVLRLAAPLVGAPLDPGESLLADRRAFVAWARVPRSDVEELTLDEVPDVTYADIGGLGRQIDEIRDAVELPFLHRDLFETFRLAAPKGVLLYGPPGCGKTMIAKAVASAAGSHFLNIKGPELLNKYVGETERQIRVIFGRARELADEGRPVVVFFDEMDSLFRTRGSGVSSDVESTIVPQLLSELDGVEGLHHVIVIGATNREDLIDPAILRPGRLDVKIKLDRPDAAGAREILAKHLTDDVPLNPATGLDDLLDAGVEALYRRDEGNRFVEVTYASGAKEVLYVADFVSGAMLANIAGRAKKAAIKEVLAGGEQGIRLHHLLDACRAEVSENEELPNTTNPDDWARVSGRRGERIAFLRTLHHARALEA
ncbi:proteasome ATPase [Nigerium sp.]|uniref:proteasome ATPase n=1 Tax=Nigerium sp. TaxID=2042655 RepID=UPI003221F043